GAVVARGGAGDIPRHRVFRFQSLFIRPGAGRVLFQFDTHKLGDRNLRLRTYPAERHGGRESCLVDHVFVHAADLRLLPGRDAADLAAAYRLAAAADLRLRRHARAGDRQGVPTRPDARRAGAERAVVRWRRLWLSAVAAQRATPGLIDAERRITT